MTCFNIYYAYYFFVFQYFYAFYLYHDALPYSFWLLFGDFTQLQKLM
ncbi:hypothetical protein E2C01_026770 [Portunus trituberculatus]|uniref:Uncharacterized protein n=1 Tax=Portunus trituberculatus TaxID=210409 RepID=A0A5B7EGE3_PORTR|nr:hypothetical protein [Portunus trituberculatus]